VFFILSLWFICTQISDDDVTTLEARRSLFERLIAESDKAYQLVSLSILLSAWPQLIVDSDGYDVLCYVVLLCCVMGVWQMVLARKHVAYK